jgi:AcrR family transcriptional regulator
VPRAGLSRAAVVAAALDVVDEQGLDALTLAAVAGRTGVAAPSLYKHVRNLAELHALVGAQVLEEMAQRFTAAVIGRSGDDAVAALMHAYRAFVTEKPARYSAVPMDPLSDPLLHDAGTQLLQVVLATLREYGLDGPAAIHAVRRLRVIVHGFASIEAAGGFGLPEDLDETYEQLIQMYLTDVAREN